MTSLKRQLTNARWHRRVISLTLCFSLLMSTTALARFRPRPTAPRGVIPPMGSRGCSMKTTLDFAALAPVSTIADLTIEHPMIAWYVPDRESYPITLKLYQDVAPNAPKPKWQLVKEFKDIQSKAGVMSFQLPPELLTEGQVYAWQAVLSCVPGYPSADLVVEAQFRVTSVSADLKQQLNRTNDAKSRVSLFADNGFWYSAFSEALSSRAVQSLLLQDLVEYERTQQSPDARWSERGRRHSELVARIVEALNQP